MASSDLLSDLMRRARALHREGRLAEARARYRTILRLAPGHPAVLHLLGVVAFQEGAFEESERLIREAIAGRDDVPAFFNNLGNTLVALGRFEEAERAFRRALSLKENYAGAQYNLGNLLKRDGRLEEALVHLRRACTLNPDHADAVCSLAQVLFQTGAIREAEEGLRRALRRRPDGVLWYELGNQYRLTGRHEEAIEAFREAVRCRPDLVAGYINLSALYQMRGQDEAALAAVRKALALDPDSPQAHFNLGQLLEGRNDLEAARVHYERALERAPDVAARVCFHLAFLVRRMCDWDGYAERTTDLVKQTERLLESPMSGSLPLLTLNLYPIPDRLRARAAQRQAQEYDAATAPLRAACAFVHTRKAPVRLRIGYVSPDFRRHAVGTVIHRLFEHHDRDQVEVFAYALVHVDDAFNQAVRAGCDTYREVSRLSDRQVARAIHADGIHVLVDLAGYTTYARPTVFALRPSPVQVHYLGYLDTMGAPFLPYVLADRTALPPDLAAAYTEAVAYLPEAFVAGSPLPVSDEPMTRTAYGLPEEAFVYASFNSPHKLDPSCFRAWMTLLRRVPEAVLWLYDGDHGAVRQNLRREARQHGVDPARLIFAGKMPLERYLARYRLADLFLDTFAYNAGATAIGALWAGLPVLTLPGTRFFSRMGASIVQAARLPELVATSEADYLDRAATLARDRSVLRQLRERLRVARDTAPLFDLPALARKLERAYWQMWHTYEAGHSPRTFDVAGG